MNHYILDADGQPQLEPDLLRWAAWSEGAPRRVARSTVGEAKVSTVFLGVDHAFGSGPPILFQTVIFNGPHDEAQWRYHTRAEAEAGHQAVVDALTSGGELP
jgi:hypothetical protein